MKIKEIDRTGNVAWSPATVEGIFLSVGTAAQHLDISSSSSSKSGNLEVYTFDVNRSGLELPLKGAVSCDLPFHRLVWGASGTAGDMGFICGGCENGVMQVYNAAKVVKGEEGALVLTKSKHTGAVKALDFNPFRANLVASGASESEIYIWDLGNPKTPMTPGTKVQPADEVVHLSWNKQVEHILASTFPTRCVVWDLRKNEPVIKLSDTTSRIKYKVVEWHPEVATQICLASEDDSSPVVQLWDLRYATAPLKIIQGHQRGILGMAWCLQDSDLLVTCGKEPRILCWNPNYPYPGYEMVCDIPTTSQFSFDVSFCPKNPIVIAAPSVDGRVSVYGLSGGIQHPVTSSKLADSFPGMDMNLAAPVPAQQPAFLQLRDAPKWLKRPCGVSFGFGGKLISFRNIKTAPVQPGQPATVSSVVTVEQLVTLPTFIDRAMQLETTLQSGALEFYCAQKASEVEDLNESKIWDFLQANFSQNPRRVYLEKLGFNPDEIFSNMEDYSLDAKVNGLSSQFEELGRGTPDGYANGYDAANVPSYQTPLKELHIHANNLTVDGKINQALLCGSLDLAVSICLKEERWADALLLASKSTPEVLQKVQNEYFRKCQNEATQVIRAVVTHDLSQLVETCSLDSWKPVLAIIITHAEQKEFLSLADQLGQRLQKSAMEDQKLGALLCCVCSGNLNHLVDVWVSDSGDKHRGDTPEDLQDLVEQVMVLKKAGEMWGRDGSIESGPLAAKLTQYSGLLASQGYLELALYFLGESNDEGLESLKDSLYAALRKNKPVATSRYARSRQSSESRCPLTKRPSYPNANAGITSSRSSSILGNTDFTNLTGPVHPPAAQPAGALGYSTNPYGNLYVNPNVAQSGGQYSPPTGPPSITDYSRPNIYNPPTDTVGSNTSHAASGRIPLGSTAPRPPVSNIAHGWNDPPMISSRTATTANTSSSSAPIPTQSFYNPAAFSNDSVRGGNYPPGSSVGQPSGGDHVPSAFYNPVNASTPTPDVGRTPLGSAHPPPPSSSVYRSWNDPPNVASRPPTVSSASSTPMPALYNPAAASSQQPNVGMPPPRVMTPLGTSSAPPPRPAPQGWGGPPPPSSAAPPQSYQAGGGYGGGNAYQTDPNYQQFPPPPAPTTYYPPPPTFN